MAAMKSRENQEYSLHDDVVTLLPESVSHVVSFVTLIHAVFMVLSEELKQLNKKTNSQRILVLL
jgi:hypothetical protein